MAIKITCKGLRNQVSLAKLNGQAHKDIAKHAEIHVTRLSSIINEKKEPSKAEMLKLCNVFDKTLEELFEIEITNTKTNK